MKWKFKFGNWRLRIVGADKMEIWSLLNPNKRYIIFKNKSDIVIE